MKKSKFKISLLVFSFALFSSIVTVTGQQTAAFLEKVAENHPAIKSYEALLEVRRSETETGNYPGAFSLGMGYFPGVPEEIGLKRTFSATQSFEFPTRYIQRARLNREMLSLAEAEFDAAKLSLLLEAKSVVYDYIASREKLEILREKEAGYNTLKEGWSKMMEEGFVTRYEFNRLNLELSRTASEIAMAEAELESIRIKLNYLSGSNALLLKDADYDQTTEPVLEELIIEKKELHPQIRLYLMEQEVALREVDLTRALNMPEIEIGIGSEIIGNHHHTGPVIGLSIPLWTNKNQLKAARARVTAAESHSYSMLEAIIAETTADFHFWLLVRNNYINTKELYKVNTDNDALTKALREKSITITDYFAFMESAYSARLTLAELRNEYNKALLRLNDHKLLN